MKTEPVENIRYINRNKYELNPYHTYVWYLCMSKNSCSILTKNPCV
jgi:hypothetical protein